MRGLKSFAGGSGIAIVCASMLVSFPRKAHAFGLERLVFPSSSQQSNPAPTSAPASTPVPAPTSTSTSRSPTGSTGGGTLPGSCTTVSEDVTTSNAGTISFPASGYFTIESHYLTTHDSVTPVSDTDGVGAHLSYSCGLLQAMGWSVSSDCHEVYPAFLATWTPAEGGGDIGMGARSDYRPGPLEEMFQGNLDYAPGQLPAPGTRYIITNPANGRSIVASFGYEIGPSSSRWLGGLTPEAHYYLDQYANDTTTLEMGRAADQTLGFGPIQCD